MKELFEKKVNLILIAIILVVAILIGIPMISRGCATSTSNGEIVTSPATADEAKKEETTEPTEESTSGDKITDSKVEIKKKNAKSSSTASVSTKSDARKTSSKTKTSSSSSKTSSRVYATAPKVANKADHQAQWNAGYLVAVDGPDTSYYCGHVELSDKDRNLIERLCMGELGSGGFTGAALIAQAVKNAMYYDGYTSVQAVINDYHYTGRLTTPTQRVKDAVIYVFDMDKDAIQHRILYMYNPKLMDKKFSDFHESQNYICTFQNVRFFDR